MILRNISRLLLFFSPTLLGAQSFMEQTHRTSIPIKSTLWRTNVIQQLIISDDSLRMEIPEVISTLDTKLDRRQVYGIAAGTAMVVSGIAAAYYKDQANRQFAEFLATGDANTLDSTHSFDRKSNAAFVVTQLSFALLSYILVSD